MKKILIHSPSTPDACSFYRGIGALAPLHKHYILEQLPNRVDWASIMGADLLYMQRPFSSTHLQVAEIAAKQIPIWVDYDVALLEVPASNPAFQTYAKPDVKKNIKKILGLASMVSFSTQILANLFECVMPIDVPFKVIPNAFNDYLFPSNVPDNPEKVVLWRGSESHQGDLFYYKDEIRQVIFDNPDWKFIFMGAVPWMIDAPLVYTSGRDIMEYFPALREEIKPSVVIVPLEDSPFNRAKSNIAWLEATYAGAVCAATDFEEWIQPGVQVFNKETFVKNVNFLLKEASLSTMLAESHQEIHPDFCLSSINTLRRDIIESLT
jgi:hypothetical protein